MGFKIGGTNISAGDVAAGAALGPVSALAVGADKLTGDHVGKGLRDAREAVFGKPNVQGVPGVDPSVEARNRLDAEKYSQMPADMKAPTMQAAQANAAQTNLADPRWAVLAHGPQEQFRNQQMALANQLSQQAAGVGPSVAQNQMRQAQQGNLAATFAQLASARGQANPAMARGTMQTAANINNQLATDSATARLQEQMAAAGMLGNVAGAARGQDIGVQGQQLNAAQTQAGMEQQTNLANAGFQQQAAQQNAMQQANFNDLRQKYLQMGLTASEANQRAAIAFSGQQMGANQANAAAENAAAASQQNFYRGLFSGAAGSVGAAGMGMATGSPAAAAAATPQASPSAADNPYAQRGGSLAAKPEEPDFSGGYGIK